MMLVFTGERHRLDDEDVALADVLLDLHEDVLVAELEHLALAQGHLQVAADRLRQLRVGVAGEDLQLVVTLPSIDSAPRHYRTDRSALNGDGPGEDLESSSRPAPAPRASVW